MKRRRLTHTQHGFSLIELSMAAVVIALLAVAITTGKGLLEAARIRSLSAELIDMNEIFVLFQEKYHDLPGDITDAWDLWGTGCMATADECNGNGDERIADTLSAPTNYETYTVWKHLQLAEMLGGNTLTGTGTAGFNFSSDVVGVNVPASDAITGAGYWVATYTILFGVAFNGTYITLAAPGVQFTPMLTPRQMSVIDNKMDDGRSRTGRIRDGASTPGARVDPVVMCSTTFTVAAGEYYADVTNRDLCNLNFRIDNVL